MKKGVIIWILIIVAGSLPHMAFNPVPPEEPDEFIDRMATSIYMNLQFPQIGFDSFHQAFQGFMQLQDKHRDLNDSLLTLIDFSKPSTEERLFIIDLKNQRVVKSSLVAHGMGSGELYARSFSNIPKSHQSSLGFYITGPTYQGRHGYSLRLRGVEPGINDNAWKRAIVIHGAHYVGRDYISAYGRLGRSFGCPALPYEHNREIIQIIRQNTCLFIYHPDPDYSRKSRFIRSAFYSQAVPE